VLFIFSLSIRLTDELYYIMLYVSCCSTHYGRWPRRLSCRILMFAAKRWSLIDTYSPLLRSGGSRGIGRKTGFGCGCIVGMIMILWWVHIICYVHRCSYIYIYVMLWWCVYTYIMHVILFFVSTFYPPKPVRARVIKNRE